MRIYSALRDKGFSLASFFLSLHASSRNTLELWWVTAGHVSNMVKGPEGSGGDVMKWIIIITTSTPSYPPSHLLQILTILYCCRWNKIAKGNYGYELSDIVVLQEETRLWQGTVCGTILPWCKGNLCRLEVISQQGFPEKWNESVGFSVYAEMRGLK